MRKELLWAGIIGISFGLIIGFGTWRVRSSLKPRDILRPTPTPVSLGQPKITLDKPEDGDVLTESSVAVTGITKPLAWLVFSGEKGDYILESSEDGTFSQNVDLISGVNQIKVTSFNTDGAAVFQKVLVVYSSLFQLSQTPSTTTEAATNDADINQKVAQKVSLAMNKPKAYIGTVTDIADSTIQIKTTDSQIEQIAIGGTGISVVNSKGTNSKVQKLTDIAIGDFVVALGYIDGNQVLKAQRILITGPVIDPKIDSSLIKVTDISKKGLNALTLSDNQKISVTPDKNTDIISFSGQKAKTIKLSDIVANDLIIVVVDNTGNTPLIRSIFDIVQPQS